MEIILKGCKDGVEKYQSLFYDMYSRKMFALCLYYCRDRMEAEDLLQEGFMKVFANVSQVRDLAVIDSWVRRVFVNTALIRYRKKNVLQFEVTMPEEDVDWTNDSIINGITAQELTSIIQTLSPQYQIVFNLYAIEGFSHKEISEMLGISEGTSKSNVSRSRVILQEKVESLYGMKYKKYSLA